HLSPSRAQGLLSSIWVGSPDTITVGPCRPQITLSPTRAMGRPSISMVEPVSGTVPPLVVVSPTTIHIRAMRGPPPECGGCYQRHPLVVPALAIHRFSISYDAQP